MWSVRKYNIVDPSSQQRVARAGFPNIPAMNISTENSPTCLCAKSWCKNDLPANFRWKICDHCRELDRHTKRRQCKHEKEKKKAKEGSSRRAQADNSSASDTEASHMENTADCPSKRPRKSGSVSLPYVVSDDTDDNSDDIDEKGRNAKVSIRFDCYIYAYLIPGIQQGGRSLRHNTRWLQNRGKDALQWFIYHIPWPSRVPSRACSDDIWGNMEGVWVQIYASTF